MCLFCLPIIGLIVASRTAAGRVLMRGTQVQGTRVFLIANAAQRLARWDCAECDKGRRTESAVIESGGGPRSEMDSDELEIRRKGTYVPSRYRQRSGSGRRSRICGRNSGGVLRQVQKAF